MHAMLTTEVANYSLTVDQYEQARNTCLAGYGLFQLWNDRLELIQSIGTVGVVPSIWTHTPVPFGMDIIALKEHFEERAASVLGDYDSAPCFDVHSPERAGLYKDNRYVHVGIRAAWMMYVDQAIEQFNSK